MLSMSRVSFDPPLVLPQGGSVTFVDVDPPFMLVVHLRRARVLETP